MIPISIIIILGIGALLILRSHIKTKRWMRAFDLHSDMFNKYMELADDPVMSDYKWKDWLPIFEMVDKICDRDCPDMKFEPISSRIRNIIDDREIIED